MITRIVKLIAATLILDGCGTLPPTHQCLQPKPQKCLRFASYNVYWQNNSNNKHNPHSIIHIIDEIKPDIIVLQETFCFSSGRLERHFKNSHPYQLFYHTKKNGHEDGLGILSKYPIVKNLYFPPKYGWFPGWLYIVKTPKGHLQVLNVHLNPPLVSDNNIGIFAEGLWLTPKVRLAEISYYYKYLNPNLPVIIAGDFNESDNGIVCDFLRKHSFNDFILAKIPMHVKTWHYRIFGFTLSGRYDRVYASHHLTLRNCQVLQKGYSDHFPVIVDVNL